MKRAAGPFEILEILGEGSFGTVCVARVSTDPLRRRVALKILKGAYASNKKILNRTRDEARLLSRINHKNIVRVERLMEVGNRPVVVMEHVQGPSVDALLLRFKDGLPAAIALEITRQTFIALDAAYQKALGEDGRPMRVIHRDIKPSNILLSIHGEVKVVDFGIAKGEFEGREAETESVVMGSRPYMAPERLDGVSDSPSVDVYSTGMTLFELLTGRTMSLSINPVNHDQAMNRQLGYIQIQGMAEPAVEDLRNLIRRMCAYTRDYRPTASECARDLEQLTYAIDAPYRIGLEEFARMTVLPIYEARPRIAPEDALQGDGDDAFLREVTGAITNPGATAKPVMQMPANVRQYTPYIFVGVLGFVVFMLFGMAGLKLLMGSGGPNTTTGTQAGAHHPVSLSVWIPSDAHAQIDTLLIPNPGRYNVDAGLQLMQMYFDDGTSLNCTFTAADGIAVRYVVDAGRAGLSVDDGPIQHCVEVKSSSAPDPAPGAPG